VLVPAGTVHLPSWQDKRMLKQLTAGTSWSRSRTSADFQKLESAKSCASATGALDCRVYLRGLPRGSQEPTGGRQARWAELERAS